MASEGNNGPPMVPHKKKVSQPKRKRRKTLQPDFPWKKFYSPRNIHALQGPDHLVASQLPEGFPEELAFRALAIYSLLRTLSRELRLSPFTPNVFLRALNLPYPSRLLGEVHVALLRILLPPMGYTYRPLGMALFKKRKIDGLKWQLKGGDNLTYLDSHTWPLFYDDYAHLTADILYERMYDETSYIDYRSLALQAGEEEDIMVIPSDDEEDDGEEESPPPKLSRGRRGGLLPTRRGRGLVMRGRAKVAAGIPGDVKSKPPPFQPKKRKLSKAEDSDSDGSFKSVESDSDDEEFEAPRKARPRAKRGLPSSKQIPGGSALKRPGIASMMMSRGGGMPGARPRQLPVGAPRFFPPKPGMYNAPQRANVPMPFAGGPMPMHSVPTMPTQSTNPHVFPGFGRGATSQAVTSTASTPVMNAETPSIPSAGAAPCNSVMNETSMGTAKASVPLSEIVKAAAPLPTAIAALSTQSSGEDPVNPPTEHMRGGGPPMDDTAKDLQSSSSLPEKVNTAAPLPTATEASSPPNSTTSRELPTKSIPSTERENAESSHAGSAEAPQSSTPLSEIVKAAAPLPTDIVALSAQSSAEEATTSIPSTEQVKTESPPTDTTKDLQSATPLSEEAKTTDPVPSEAVKPETSHTTKRKQNSTPLSEIVKAAAPLPTAIATLSTQSSGELPSKAEIPPTEDLQSAIPLPEKVNTAIPLSTAGSASSPPRSTHSGDFPMKSIQSAEQAKTESSHVDKEEILQRSILLPEMVKAPAALPITTTTSSPPSSTNSGELSPKPILSTEQESFIPLSEMVKVAAPLSTAVAALPKQSSTNSGEPATKAIPPNEQVKAESPSADTTKVLLSPSEIVKAATPLPSNSAALATPSLRNSGEPTAKAIPPTEQAKAESSRIDTTKVLLSPTEIVRAETPLSSNTVGSSTPSATSHGEKPVKYASSTEQVDTEHPSMDTEIVKSPTSLSSAIAIPSTPSVTSPGELPVKSVPSTEQVQAESLPIDATKGLQNSTEIVKAPTPLPPATAASSTPSATNSVELPVKSVPSIEQVKSESPPMDSEIVTSPTLLPPATAASTPSSTNPGELPVKSVPPTEQVKAESLPIDATKVLQNLTEMEAPAPLLPATAAPSVPSSTNPGELPVKSTLSIEQVQPESPPIDATKVLQNSAEIVKASTPPPPATAASSTPSSSSKNPGELPVKSNLSTEQVQPERQPIDTEIMKAPTPLSSAIATSAASPGELPVESVPSAEQVKSESPPIDATKVLQNSTETVKAATRLPPTIAASSTPSSINPGEFPAESAPSTEQMETESPSMDTLIVKAPTPLPPAVATSSTPNPTNPVEVEVKSIPSTERVKIESPLMTQKAKLINPVEAHDSPTMSVSPVKAASESTIAFEPVKSSPKAIVISERTRSNFSESAGSATAAECGGQKTEALKAVSSESVIQARSPETANATPIPSSKVMQSEARNSAYSESAVPVGLTEPARPPIKAIPSAQPEPKGTVSSTETPSTGGKRAREQEMLHQSVKAARTRDATNVIRPAGAPPVAQPAFHSIPGPGVPSMSAPPHPGFVGWPNPGMPPMGAMQGRFPMHTPDGRPAMQMDTIGSHAMPPMMPGAFYGDGRPMLHMPNAHMRLPGAPFPRPGASFPHGIPHSGNGRQGSQIPKRPMFTHMPRPGVASHLPNMASRPKINVRAPPVPKVKLAKAKPRGMAVSDEVADAIESFVRGRPKPPPPESPSLPRNVAGPSAAASTANETGNPWHDEPELVEWPQFVPIERMREGEPYHRLPIEQKLQALEFLIDELLNVDYIAAEFTRRQAITSCYSHRFGVLPTKEELDSLENADECGVCGLEGDLLCCDGCPSSYHKRCIGMAERTQLPEGIWLCPECRIKDPACFGSLKGDRKACVDWFQLDELAGICDASRQAKESALSNGVSDPFNSTAVAPMHNSEYSVIRPGSQVLHDEHGTQHRGTFSALVDRAKATGAVLDESLMTINGFVFKHVGLSQVGPIDTFEKMTRLRDESSSFRICTQKELFSMCQQLGRPLLEQWPLVQVPLSPAKIWGPSNAPIQSQSIGTFFDVDKSFDPSKYVSLYRDAPLPKALKAGAGSKDPSLVLSDYENRCFAADMRMLSLHLSADASYDSNLAQALRLGTNMFQPHRTISGYLEKLESTFARAGLLSEFWGLRNKDFRQDVWVQNVRRCRSVPKLAKLLVTLIDVVHPLAFYEEWFQAQNTRSSKSGRDDTHDERRSYRTLPDDWSITKEKKKRKWEHCGQSNVLSLLSADSRNLSEFLDGARLRDRLIGRKRKAVKLVMGSELKDKKPPTITTAVQKMVVQNQQDIVARKTAAAATDTVTDITAVKEVHVSFSVIDKNPPVASVKNEVSKTIGQYADPWKGTEWKPPLPFGGMPNPNHAGQTEMPETFKSPAITSHESSVTPTPAKKELKSLDTTNSRKRRSRRQGRDETGPGSLAAPMGIGGLDDIIAHTTAKKVKELESMLTVPMEKEINWPVCGRYFFDPIGYLPPVQMRRLGRNAGTAKAANMTYSKTHEVGQGATCHIWRKQCLDCVSYEPLLLLLRELQSFLDEQIIFSCETAKRRYKNNKSALAKEIACAQRDLETGELHYFVHHKGRRRGCWLPVSRIDTASYVVEREKRVESLRVAWDIKANARKKLEREKAERELAARRKAAAEAEAARRQREAAELAVKMRERQAAAAQAAAQAQRARDAAIANAEAARRKQAELQIRQQSLSTASQLYGIQGQRASSSMQSHAQVQATQLDERRRLEIQQIQSQLEETLKSHETETEKLLLKCLTAGLQSIPERIMMDLRSRHYAVMLDVSSNIRKLGGPTVKEAKLKSLMSNSENRARTKFRASLRSTNQSRPSSQSSTRGAQELSQMHQPSTSHQPRSSAVNSNSRQLSQMQASLPPQQQRAYSQESQGQANRFPASQAPSYAQNLTAQLAAIGGQSMYGASQVQPLRTQQQQQQQQQQQLYQTLGQSAMSLQYPQNNYTGQVGNMPGMQLQNQYGIAGQQQQGQNQHAYMLQQQQSLQQQYQTPQMQQRLQVPMQQRPPQRQQQDSEISFDFEPRPLEEMSRHQQQNNPRNQSQWR